jgi:hypothetical protein
MVLTNRGQKVLRAGNSERRNPLAGRVGIANNRRMSAIGLRCGKCSISSAQAGGLYGFDAARLMLGEREVKDVEGGGDWA